MGRRSARGRRGRRVSRGIGHEAGRQVTPRQVAELLAETDLFGVLDAATLAEVAEHTLTKVAEKGQTIFVQDEPGDRLFVIAEGAVKLVVRSAQGDVVELARHWRPAVFGEVALLDGGRRSATAEAVERTTLAVVTRDDLIRLLRSTSQIVDQVLKALGGLIRRADQQAIELVFLDLPGRLARRLLELANMVGGSRQSVNIALRSLEKRGFVRVVGSSIELLDPAELRRRAGW